MSTSFWHITKESRKSAVVATNQTYMGHISHARLETKNLKVDWMDASAVTFITDWSISFNTSWASWYQLVLNSCQTQELLSEYAKIAARPPSFTSLQMVLRFPPLFLPLATDWSGHSTFRWKFCKMDLQHFRLDTKQSSCLKRWLGQKTKTELITSKVRITCVQKPLILTSSFSSLSSHNLPQSAPTTHL